MQADAQERVRRAMTTARTVLPTDLVALVSYDGRIYANEAMTRDRLGTHESPHPLEAAFEQWFSFATGRHTWISVEGATLRGLLSARKRGSRLAWEVDCLIDATEDDDSVMMSLLDRMTTAAGKSGALRIFLRLPAGSPTEGTAERSGFVPYERERVYRREAGDRRAPSSPEGLRRRHRGDAYQVFRLYNALTPEHVRRIEAMTLAEWNSVQERIGRTSQLVIERDGIVRAALRVAADGDVGRFDAIGTPELMDDVVDAATAKLANRRWIYALVPDHQEPLRRRLEERGFDAGEEYVVLARRTVRPVTATKKKKAKPAPALVKMTLG
jgi:hypothetical protein